ncbi:hypothetical protein [Flavobacterium sp. GCM10027622]|uniref:hypothetical protein n=1 Tax=unclassified Flavobacterium TaxID=196869 RepID=UPI0036245334
MTNENFIYHIDLDYILVCENFIRSNHLASPAMFHYITYKTEYPIYTINLDNLLSELDATQIGFSSPRFLNLTITNWSRNGLKVGLGIENAQYYSKEKLKKFARISELEIEFERVRREIDNNLPSRLCCIFLALDNFDSRTMLKNMFWDKTNFIIAPIEIKYKHRFHQADSKWIEEYEKTKHKSAIENYWLGKNFDNNPEYEYLLEGLIELCDSKDREYIKNHYARDY